MLLSIATPFVLTISYKRFPASFVIPAGGGFILSFAGAILNNGDESSEESDEQISSTTTESYESIIEEVQREFRNKLNSDQLTGTDPRREWLILDANSGELIKKWQGLTSAMGMSRVPLLVGLRHSPMEYEEYMRKNVATEECYYQKIIGNQIYLTVSDLRRPGSSFRNAFSFLCNQAASSSYDITNGAASPRNSAYKWASEALNFFRRAGNSKIDFHLDVEVHHPGLGAYWTGRHVALGDGDAQFYYPMTTPDIVVHEVAHAFTENNAGMFYMGQSGAIDESYSDMAACAFMNYFYNDETADVYMIGKKASKYNVAMRDMCNPTSSNLMFYDPAKPVITSANEWVHSTGIHNASSLYNKAFCVLSKTRGWNIFRAFKVFTAANMIYWDRKDSFNSAACGVIKAAYNLMGTATAQRDVEIAFSEVGIQCPPES